MMRIVHLSYARMSSYKDPEAWLQRINFYTGIPEAMAVEHEVDSIHCIGCSGAMRRNNVNYHFAKLTWWQHLFPWALNRYVRKLNPDVIIIHGLLFGWQIFLLHWQLGRKPRIFAQHHAERPFQFHRKFFHRLNDAFISGYFFSSFQLSKPWLDENQIRDASKVYEIMEASSVFYPIEKAEARKFTGIPSSPVYLWVGRLDENKDPITLAKGFAKFLRHEPQARLYVVYQQDDLLTTMKKIVAHHPEQMILVGKVSHSELLYWFNSADFIISTSHYEGSGIAVCEAMSCGCIPIVSDIPSFRMMTNDGGCGILFEPGKADDLTKALIASTTLNRGDAQTKVLDYFHQHLSFKAIARKMIAAVNEKRQAN